MSLNRVRGSAWDTQDNLVVDLIADLSGVKTEGIIFVSGEITVNDGGGGWYKWEARIPKSTADGSSIVNPSDTPSGSGCWVRQRFTVSEFNGKNNSETQLAYLGQTIVKIHNFTYEPGKGQLAVYVEGLRLIPDAFEETDTSTITLLAPLRAEDTIQIVAHEHPEPGEQECTEAALVCYNNANSVLYSSNVQAAIDELANLRSPSGIYRTEILWINAQGQDTFTWKHNTKALDVYLNGVKVDPVNGYVADGEEIILTTPIGNASDRLYGVTYAAAEDINPSYYLTASWTDVQGQAVFEWQHDPGTLNVYLNGSHLVYIKDYTTDGQYLTLTASIIREEDILEASCFTPFTVADAVPLTQYTFEQGQQDSRLDTLEIAILPIEDNLVIIEADILDLQGQATETDTEQGVQDSRLDTVELHTASIPSVMHLPVGGNAGQVAVKQSSSDGDVVWTTPTGITKVGAVLSGSGSTIEEVVNVTTFTSGTSEAGRLVIGISTLCTINYDGVTYEYAGPNEVEIGAGAGPGTYPLHTCIADDFFVAAIGDHNHLSGLTEEGAHPMTSITGLPAAIDAKKDDFTENTAFNKDFGTLASTVCEGDDVRLSNDRDPNAHTHPISEVDTLQATIDALVAGVNSKKDDFTENDAFNKTFGTGNDNVCRGSDARLGLAGTALQSVSDDTSPILGGHLVTGGANAYDIIYTNASDVIQGVTGTTVAGDAIFIAKSDSTGSYSEDDGGILVKAGGLELHGATLEILSLENTDPAGYQELRISNDGYVFAASPPAPGWVETDESTSDIEVPVSGDWTLIAGLSINLPEDVAPTDLIDIVAKMYLICGAKDESITLSISTDGSAPTVNGPAVFLKQDFAGYVNFGMSSADHNGGTAGQTLSIWMHTLTGESEVSANGSVQPHELTVSVPNNAVVMSQALTLDAPPATSDSFGNTGDVRWDSKYVYLCIAPNTWKRTKLSDW